jgi:sodium/bile acid cotransporter 7
VRLDPFTSILIVVVALASFFPCEGQVAVWFALLTKLAVALLFFMHGAKLSRQNLLAGLGHWRLHLVVMASTFVLFPLLGLLLTPLVPQWLSPAIYLGFLYLCALPATVQSAIAFTSMAGGNVSTASRTPKRCRPRSTSPSSSGWTTTPSARNRTPRWHVVAAAL